MKKYFLLLIALVAISFSSSAQKFAYVDSEYILGNITEYNEAQTKLDDISKGWQKEIETKYKEIDQMYKNYQQEQVLLTEEMKQNRQKEIEDKEKAAKESATPTTTTTSQPSASPTTMSLIEQMLSLSNTRRPSGRRRQ